MDDWVRGLGGIAGTPSRVVGGKAVGLGELSRMEGVRVPAGFCVTTEAFRRIEGDVPGFDERLDRLSRMRSEEPVEMRAIITDLRRDIEEVDVPQDLSAAITRAVVLLGEDVAYAVRSSATAEDLASASFAGQLDSYLNVVGSRSILRHLSACWASLFTERAVLYRLRNDIDHRTVQMAVIVQQMVVPDAAGVMFTADPVTSNRKIVSVEAVPGLGESLVSGRVAPDAYQVRDGDIVTAAVAIKRLAVRPLSGGGTEEVPIDPRCQGRPVLTDAQILELSRLGRRIEDHFGCPQDIEWCLARDEFWVVQSRPITTLFASPISGSDRPRASR